MDRHKARHTALLPAHGIKLATHSTRSMAPIVYIVATQHMKSKRNNMKVSFQAHTIVDPDSVVDGHVQLEVEWPDDFHVSLRLNQSHEMKHLANALRQFAADIEHLDNPSNRKE